ncbi:hypothetical protein QM091_15140 [Enterobacter roggenkampii]|uniref:hypothetical protein n=1 Tax=Enterobacter TaxID=547 RepID=UPI000DEF8006|nr:MULTISPECIES: hypothetical protein [Enterobacter]MDH1654798.1 hypothetical protein [Enterobacter roggenkampii]MDV5320178.1 hypothetical protein [Enterobacter roggenkampii]MDV5330126.1 hypothetical protein [Enterobacter roggenkampii]MDV5681116.1 hypothetical protein [Enterobacter roggenkampii]RCL21795.1 hypothetical protein C6A40_19765 [Enterobacter sp. GER_MD16_1505_Eko_090]
MTKVSLPGKGHLVEKTIDSQSLLEMVNQARKQCGEPEVRNNKFIEKIVDELEGEFYTKSVKPSGSNGGRPVEVIDMTIKQALRVAARESKSVRRSLVDKLEDMKALPAMPKSNTGITEYRLAKADQLKAQALEKNIASAREIMSLLPRLDPMAHQTLAASLINPLIGYDAIPLPVIEEHYHTAGEVGDMLGVSAQKIGRIANANNLKTEQNGKFFLDKSVHSNKQVEAFRYNAEGVKALRHLIHGADVA